ncbi:MAG: DUF4288 domain-containing protein [Clostridia bacterium]|nr:DUF4288 domain-containing protein [Clostridia bacterium]
MKYGVKVIYTYSVGENSRKYYEESILSVTAESFEEAYEKAEEYAKENSDEHINPHGELVKTEKIEMLDCFLAGDKENDVQEIYSSINNNKTSLNEEEFYDAITTQCSTEELYDLRYEEFNKLY